MRWLWPGMVLALVLMALLSGRSVRQQGRETAAIQHNGTTVIIDPGHGGEDGGATGVTGARESEINLEVSLRLQTMLRLFGIEPVMVRETDTAVYSEGAKSISEKKVSDIHNRVDLVNETPNALLISVHQNFFTESKYSGAQVFYAGNGESKALAEQLQQLLRMSLDPANHREAKCAASSVYLMNHVDATAVLVECGFLSNAEEEAKLQTEEYQKKLAITIAAAVTQYLEDTNEV